MLTQVNIQTPLPTVINRTAAPVPRVKPVVQPPRVKPSKPEPIAHPRVQHAPPPTIDTYTNPWVGLFYNRNNNTPTIPTKTNPDLPRQVQHRLRFTMLNGGTNFRDQSSLHLVAHHMFNLQYDFQI